MNIVLQELLVTAMNLFFFAQVRLRVGAQSQRHPDAEWGGGRTAVRQRESQRNDVLLSARQGQGQILQREKERDMRGVIVSRRGGAVGRAVIVVPVFFA